MNIRPSIVEAANFYPWRAAFYFPQEQTVQCLLFCSATPLLERQVGVKPEEH